MHPRGTSESGSITSTTSMGSTRQSLDSKQESEIYKDPEVGIGLQDSSSSAVVNAAALTEKPEQREILTATDWNDADDPENPHNWGLWKRIYHTANPAGMALVATFASSAFTPCIPPLTTEFHISEEIARVAFVVFVFGFIAGAPIASPCSEAFGRKPVYLIFMPIFALFILGTGFAKDIGTLIVCRLFAGVFASPALSIGSGTIADVWPAQKRLIPMSFYIAAPLLGPTLGPLIGEFVVDHKGWRWSSWVILFFIIAFLTPLCFMSETYKKIILQRRARRLNIPGPPSPTDGLTPRQKVKTFLRNTLSRPMHMLFTEPVVAYFGLYASFNFALQYAFFSIFPHVFRDQYGFSEDRVGLTFIGMGVGSSLGLAVIIMSDGPIKRRVRAYLARSHSTHPDDNPIGPLAPEHRLYIAMFGGLFLPPSLFLFGWSAQYKVHWIVPVIAEALFGFGNILVFMAGLMYVTDVYGAKFAASAMAANTFLRYIFAGGFPLFGVQMFYGMGIGGASSLLGGVSVLLAGIPWIFYYFGPRLRSRSSYVGDY